MKLFILALLVFLSLAAFAARPRIIVLTDIEGEPDEEESMVRFLLYSNEFDIEGLMPTGRGVRDDRPVLLPRLINEQIKAYGEVREDLLLHESGYQGLEYLLDKVKSVYNIPKMTTTELYDQNTDLRKETNVVEQNPEVVKGLLTIMKNSRIENAERPFIEMMTN